MKPKLWLAVLCYTGPIVTYQNVEEYIIKARTKKDATFIVEDEFEDSNLIELRPLTLEDIERAMTDKFSELFL